MQEAVNRYEYGAYNEAIEHFHRLLYPVTSLDQEETETAHAYLGVCYYLTDQKEKAREEFQILLSLNPNYNLDPVLFPPRIVDFYNEIAQGIGPEADLPPPEPTKGRPNLFGGRKKTMALAFFPLGVGQLQNGESFKGLVFFTSEIALASMSLYYYAARKELEEESNSGIFGGGTYKNPQEARQMQDIQIITGIAFWGVVGWGIADAIYFYENPAEAQTRIRTTLVPRLDSKTIGLNLAIEF